MKIALKYKVIPIAACALSVCATVSGIQTAYAAESAQTQQASLAAFTPDGKLQRPTGYREWTYVGTPLTPNDMNNGKAAFPEFHNVYIDPLSWAHWKQSGNFQDGTVIVKELVNVASKQSFSGNGYFMGDFIGLEAMVKSRKHFPEEPGNWGFFRFTNDKTYRYSDLASTAAALPTAACAGCHESGAKDDLVFTQHYPVLRAARSQGNKGTGGY